MLLRCSTPPGKSDAFNSPLRRRLIVFSLLPKAARNAKRQLRYRRLDFYCIHLVVFPDGFGRSVGFTERVSFSIVSWLFPRGATPHECFTAADAGTPGTTEHSQIIRIFQWVLGAPNSGPDSVGGFGLL
jgi:hypothetical protein